MRNSRKETLGRKDARLCERAVGCCGWSSADRTVVWRLQWRKLGPKAALRGLLCCFYGRKGLLADLSLQKIKRIIMRIFNSFTFVPLRPSPMERHKTNRTKRRIFRARPDCGREARQDQVPLPKFGGVEERIRMIVLCGLFEQVACTRRGKLWGVNGEWCYCWDRRRARNGTPGEASVLPNYLWIMRESGR